MKDFISKNSSLQSSSGTAVTSLGNIVVEKQTVAGEVVDLSNILSPDLHVLNVQQLEYSVTGKDAIINPATGLLAISGNADKGNATVSVKVTLKNGKSKTLKVQVVY